MMSLLPKEMRCDSLKGYESGMVTILDFSSGSVKMQLNGAETSNWRVQEQSSGWTSDLATALRNVYGLEMPFLS